MRVITGTARGSNLDTLAGEDVRPTTQRVKEAVFSTVQFYVPGALVLDLFAGSGQMGIEALSRGASAAVFVDASAESIAVIRKNLAKTGLGEKAKVSKNDAFRHLARPGQLYDIVFIDPPYGLGLAKKALRRVSEQVADGGFVVCETEAKAGMPEAAGPLTLQKKYSYGATDVWLYRNTERETHEEL